MKPTFDIQPGLFKNEDQFADPFFRRFSLRHNKSPLQLNESISKNYFFPTFYNDVTCAIAIFLCDYQKAVQIMPHPKMKPVKMTKGRSLVVFSCYEYKKVMNVLPYNEIAMTIPVMIDPKINIPLLPMVTDKLFKNFGYYVFSMPVTSLENQIRGRKIWGLPKVVQEISVNQKNGFCTTTAFEEDGKQYLKIKVPIEGTPTDFDVGANLYSSLDGQLLQSPTNFKAVFNMTKYMNLLFEKNKKPDKNFLEIGDTPSGKALKALDIEEHPFQFRFAKNMTSCFDLPNADYRSSLSF